MTERRVLVTGAAKRIGAAIARRLAADGWRVAVHYNGSRDEAEAVAAEIGGAAVQGDLADPTIGAWLLAEAEKALGGCITGLVNSASVFEFDRPGADDGTRLTRLMQVNLSAPVALSADLAARAQGDAAVVNLLDQKVGNLNPDFFSYTCTKVALAAATTMMAQAFAPRMRVNAVSPGLTLASGDQSAAEFAAAGRKNLLQRPVGAVAVADAVAYLLAAQSVTGQNLFVDCGQRFLKRDGDVMFEGRDA